MGNIKTEGQPVWRITTSLLIMDKIELNDNQYGELLFHFCLHKIKMNDEKTLNKIEMSGNEYGGLIYTCTSMADYNMTDYNMSC